VLLEMLLTALLIAAVVSIDMLASGFAYGTANTRVPFRYVLFINAFCGVALGAALSAGYFISRIIPKAVTLGISIAALAGLGLFKIFQYLRRRKRSEGKPPAQQISWGEATALAAILSIDGMAVGVGTAVYNAEILFCVLAVGFTLAAGIVLFAFGNFLGRRLTTHAAPDLSWLGGLVLIALAAAQPFI
jgi:putative Mn2+ efflux pump MntP